MAGYDIPFVPTSDNHTKIMMRLAKIKSGEKAVDLGAGEGKLVLAMARKGASVTGVEIDKERAIKAAMAIKRSGLDERAEIIQDSFWSHDLSPYDVIMLYGVPSIMDRLEKKILNEAKESARIVSNHFEFPSLKELVNKQDVHLYKPLVRLGLKQQSAAT